MTNSEDHQLAFWERAAVSAVAAILANEKDSTVADAAGMAAHCADALLCEWRERFNGPAGMTSADYEAEGTAESNV